MNSADLVKIARQRAGLTQAQLAKRSGIPRETIARWETGTREPSLSSLQRLVDNLGLDLVIGIAEGDDSLGELVRDQLALPPLERLASLLPAKAYRASVSALKWLGRVGAEAILIGPVAAALQGGPQRPGDGWVEVVAADSPDFHDELERAGYRPLDSPERYAESDRRWPWKRRASTIAVATELPGSSGYADLRRSARQLELRDRSDTPPFTVQVAHPRDLLRLAEASPRSGEQARVPGLRALLDEFVAEKMG